MPFVLLVGVALNLVGTVLICLSAVRLFASIRAGFTAQGEALQAVAGGRAIVATPLDERRESDFTTAEGRLRIGFRLVAAGFALQLTGIVPSLIAAAAS